MPIGRAVLLVATVLGFAGIAPARAEVQTTEVEGTRLTVPVQETLLRLQDQWLLWNSAFLQGDRGLAWAAVRDLRGIASDMGLERLPEPALGMLVRALEAARSGDRNRADWALEMAAELDLRTPEWSFAAWRVAWLRGDYLSGIGRLFEGYGRMFQRSLKSRLWLLDLALWAALCVFVTACFYVALQMGTKGSSLFRDLVAGFTGFLPGWAGLLAAVVALIWPLALPNGWIGLVLLWAVLLWGYGSSSERWAMTAAIGILCVGPLAVQESQRGVDVELRPESRLLESLSQGVLYGRIFHDLSALRSSLPDDPGLLQLVADLHVRLGQDDLARPIYRQVVELEPENGAALNNLGTFHFFRQEYVQAIEYFDRAARYDESKLAANYNLSQTYSHLMEFENDQLYLGRARAIDIRQVTRWDDENRAAVVMAGGIARIPEIEARLRQTLRAGQKPINYGAWGGLVAGVLLAAWLIRSTSRIGAAAHVSAKSGARLGRFERIVRFLLPGVASSEAGDGGRAFAALLIPIAAVLLPLSGAFGYAVPWGLDPGTMLAWTLAALTLVSFFSVRWVLR